MKHESILSQLVVAAIYITLGIPLIVTSSQSPKILEPDNAGKISKTAGTAICVSYGVLHPKTGSPAHPNTGSPVGSRDINSATLKNMMGTDKKLASTMNASKTCSLVIGIILLCFAFLNIVSVLVPKKRKK